MKLKESVFLQVLNLKKSVLRLVFLLIMLFLSLSKHQYTLSKKAKICYPFSFKFSRFY